MHPEESDPVSAVVVTPRPDGEDAEVRDLRTPDSSYVAPTWTMNDDTASNGTDAIVA